MLAHARGEGFGHGCGLKKGSASVDIAGEKQEHA
jgi:hypothetical protein